MSREDMIKRRIEELGRVLGKVLFDLINNSTGSVSDGIERASQQVKEEAGLDLKKLISVPPEELIKTIASETNLKNQHLETLADIFFEAGRLHIHSKEEEQGKELYKKAIILLEHKGVIDKTYSMEREGKIAAIKNLL